MTTQWGKVHVFISSTFNDMHAERDYLVKQVFPELREWCEKRKLNLVDIDLRWGITEQDALHNKSVVQVCLERIDGCRPFFLCFLGQRRGWVPGEADISAATFEEFPGLRRYMGDASVTEMEILHALLDPLHGGTVPDSTMPAESYEPAKHAFFYLRDHSYLGQLPTDPPLLRQTYTNEGIENEEERAQHDAQLKQWRADKIPATGRPARPYQATWDEHLITPELLLPLQCPSSEPTSVKRWQEQWAKAGVVATDDDIAQDPSQAEKARAFNRRLIAGRLTDFRCETQPLSTVILDDLKEAIAARYPNHMEVSGETDLQKELDQQEQFLYIGGEGFIPRGGDFRELDAYADGREERLFVLTAPGGMGKSTLLANWIDHYRAKTEGKPGHSIHFRFIGQSDRSTRVDSLLHSLMQELKEIAGKLTIDIPGDPQELRQELPKLLEDVAKQGRTVIVLDALNQLESGLSNLSWLPYHLPENIKLVVSFKSGDQAADELLESQRGQAILTEVRPLANLDDRRKLVKAYLAQYLKDLDERHLETLIQSLGADNPLFLKVVLSELRVFGAFANLGQKIRLDFGKTPISAFEGVLKRLENDPSYSPIDPRQAVPVLFGLLAHARKGLSVEELIELVFQTLRLETSGISQRAAADTVNLYLRQVRPFLAHRDGRYDFFFESFRLAARQLYEGEPLPRRLAQGWHKLLADYFVAKPIILAGNLDQPNIRKCFEQAYQQTEAKSWSDLVQTLTTTLLIDAKVKAHLLDDLLSDYTVADALIPESKAKTSIDAYHNIVRLEQHHLRAYPNDAFQYIHDRLCLVGNERNRAALALSRETYLKQGGTFLEPYGNVGSTSSRLLLTLAGHAAGITACVFSPDGTQICSSGDPILRIWDVATGKSIATMIGHTDDVTCCAYSPDGKLIVSGSKDATLKIWDSRSGSAIRSLSGHKFGVKYCAFLSDGSHVVSHGEDGMLIFWDTSTGALKTAMQTQTYVGDLKGLHDIVSCILSQDGTFVSLARTAYADNGGIPWPVGNDWDEVVELWDIVGGTKRTLRSRQSNSGMLIDTCAFSSTGSRLACASSDGRLTVWDTSTGRELSSLTGHACRSPVFSTDGQLVGFASGHATLKLWDIETGHLTTIVTGHHGGVECCGFSGDGGLVISGSDDKTVKVWRANAEEETLTEAGTKHAGAVRSCVFSPDGKFFASASDDNTLKLWESQNGKLVTTLTGHTAEVTSCAVSPDSSRVVSGGRDQTLRLWDSETGAELQVFSGHQAIVTSCYFSPDGSQIVSGSGDATLMVTDVRTGTILHHLIGHSESVEACCYSPDGSLIASGGYDNTLRLWSAGTGKELATLTGHTACIRACGFSPDSKKVVSGGYDNTIKLWNISNGDAIGTLNCHTDAVEACSVAANGRFIASASYDGTVRLWDIITGTNFATYDLDVKIVSACISPSSRLIACGDMVGTVHLFKLHTYYSDVGTLSEAPAAACQ